MKAPVARFLGTATRILAEFGDGSAFATSSKLAGRCRLAPVTRQSGTTLAGEIPLPQRQPPARKTPCSLAAFAALRDPASEAFDDRKRAEGKRHNAALICLARRRCDVSLAMLRTGQPYQPPGPRPACPGGRRDPSRPNPAPLACLNSSSTGHPSTTSPASSPPSPVRSASLAGEGTWTPSTTSCAVDSAPLRADSPCDGPSAISAQRLGWPETIRFTENKLTTCHPANIPRVQADLAAARRGEGQTLFDIITSIIRAHGPGGIEAEDGF